MDGLAKSGAGQASANSAYAIALSASSHLRAIYCGVPRIIRPERIGQSSPQQYPVSDISKLRTKRPFSPVELRAQYIRDGLPVDVAVVQVAILQRMRPIVDGQTIRVRRAARQTAQSADTFQGRVRAGMSLVDVTGEHLSALVEY